MTNQLSVVAGVVAGVVVRVVTGVVTRVGVELRLWKHIVCVEEGGRGPSYVVRLI